MKRRAVRLPMPVLAQDGLLGLLVAVTQVQGTVAKPSDVGARPLTDFGHLGYARLIAAEALERARQAERTREEEARSRVDAERLRIAREVHDTVAHAIAIINVQAGVTAYTLDKRPERAREALVTIEQTSAQVLHEMRAVIRELRDSDNGRVARPGLGQVNALTAMAREAGLDIKLEVTSCTAPLPSAVDHTAYRILQESITNVIRHVGPTRVTVALDYSPDV